MTPHEPEPSLRPLAVMLAYVVLASAGLYVTLNTLLTIGRP